MKSIGRTPAIATQKQQKMNCEITILMCFYFYRYLFLLLTLVQVAFGVKIALLIIDVQNCFLPGGSLAVTNGEEVIPVINHIRSKYISLVVLSQDWHCVNHVSFASQHEGKSPYDTIQLQYNQQGIVFLPTCNMFHFVDVDDNDVINFKDNSFNFILLLQFS